jgi:hypothetical protein
MFLFAINVGADMLRAEFENHLRSNSIKCATINPRAKEDTAKSNSSSLTVISKAP